MLTVARPDRIILFGSAATGQMTKDSDIDLLVVEPEPANTRDRSVRIRRAMGGVPYPVDVIVMSSERFEETKNIIGGSLTRHRSRDASSRKPPDVAIRELVRQWIDKAAADLDVEKYLKALLVRHQIEFPKTHDLAKLLDRVTTVNANMAESQRDADALTPFGVEVRSPSDAPELLPRGEAEAAHSHVRHVPPACKGAAPPIRILPLPLAPPNTLQCDLSVEP